MTASVVQESVCTRERPESMQEEYQELLVCNGPKTGMTLGEQ